MFEQKKANLSLEEMARRLDELTTENARLKAENESLLEQASDPQKTIDEQNAQLKKYNKELEQFTYVATHDLKSPLANIQGYLDLLELDIENPSDEVKDSLKWLKYSVSEARNVIQELTNALKARNHKEELLQPIDMDQMVESILAGMRSRILASRIVFISDFTAINSFNYYPVALRSILQNIISNAIQYSKKVKNPEVIISTKLKDDTVFISIQDNGVGIDLDQNKSKVFGLFKRIQNDENGSGIGMYIVNKLLENYGGQLDLKSEPGQGSTFTIAIPYNNS